MKWIYRGFFWQPIIHCYGFPQLRSWCYRDSGAWNEMTMAFIHFRTLLRVVCILILLISIQFASTKVFVKFQTFQQKFYPQARYLPEDIFKSLWTKIIYWFLYRKSVLFLLLLNYSSDLISKKFRCIADFEISISQMRLRVSACTFSVEPLLHRRINNSL